MAAINKVTYKIKNLSDAPISFVGLHTLTIPGASDAEYSMSEAAWKKLLPRIRAKKTLVVTKVTGAADDTASTTSTTKATASTTSTKTSSTKTSTKAAAKDTASTASSATTSADTTTDTSTDATTSTKEG